MENSFKINIPIIFGYPFICIYDDKELVDLDVTDLDDEMISKNEHSIVFCGVHGYNGLNVVNIYLDSETWNTKYPMCKTHEMVIRSGELKIQGGWDELGKYDIFATIPTARKVRMHYVVEHGCTFNIYIQELDK